MDQSETCHLKDRAIYLKGTKIIHVFLFIPQEKKTQQMLTLIIARQNCRHLPGTLDTFNMMDRNTSLVSPLAPAQLCI